MQTKSLQAAIKLVTAKLPKMSLYERLEALESIRQSYELLEKLRGEKC